jgi:hypothetical protein
MFEKPGSYLFKIKCAPNMEQVGCFVQGVLARPKVVTKSYGKRNFMQPMGRPKHAVRVPCSFPFKFWGGGGEGGVGQAREFFSFFLGSHCVSTMFPLSSQWVPTCSQYVPQVHNVFPNMFSIAPHFYPICFGTCSPPFTYIGGPKRRNYIFQNRNFCFR